MDARAIIRTKRDGGELAEEEIRAFLAGYLADEVPEYQAAALLAAIFIRGMGAAELERWTRGMLATGTALDFAGLERPVVDKHSTGGVGDKVSLALAPALAACGAAVPMISGRGLGHTGGTLDKLESIPGFRTDLSVEEIQRAVRRRGLALAAQTAEIAPADRRLYALRDRTGTVSSIPLVVGSILSKKLATGAAAIVFDVKTGDGAFLPELARGRELARRMVEITRGLDVRASALLSDMDQPLGEWAGHAAEVREALDCLEGGGPRETVELTVALALELARLTGAGLDDGALRATLGSGRAREAFVRWAVAQGAERAWFDRPRLELAPVERPILAPREGVLRRVATRRLGELLGDAGGARREAGGELDRGVALRYSARIGRAVARGEELARVYLREEDPWLVGRFAACFEIDEQAEARDLIVGRVD
jgi:pyrimidine-nucleoside phosphorylase